MSRFDRDRRDHSGRLRDQGAGMTTPAEPECTCGAGPGGLIRPGIGRHSITCMVEAATQPNAMVNDGGDVFYPDDAEDAAEFADRYGARFLNPQAAITALGLDPDEWRNG